MSKFSLRVVSQPFAIMAAATAAASPVLAQGLFPDTVEHWEGLISPTAVVARDFDLDGKTDIIAMSALSQVPLVAPGNGDGTFDRQRLLPAAGGTIRFLSAADVNGDGLVDLVATISTGTPDGGVLYLNRGDFVFEVVPIGSVQRAIQWTQVADVNGDGFLDFIAATVGINSSSGAIGAGLFVWRFDGTAFDATPITVTTEPIDRVRAVDLTGDGASDLIFHAISTGEWRFAESLGSAGFAVPVSAFDPAIAFLPLVDVADLDGDSDLDLYALDEPSTRRLFIAESLGGLSFGPLVSVTLTQDATPSRLAPRDLDGDGLEEIFVSSVLPFRERVIPALGGLAVGPDERLSLDMAAYDFGDIVTGGRLEAVGISGSDLAFAEADLSGGSTWLATPQDVARRVGFLNSLETTDLDGDGDEDVLFLTDEVGFQWLRNEGALRFGRPQTIQGQAGVESVLDVLDLNGDGLEDLLVRTSPNGGVGVQLRQAPLSFAAPTTISSVGAGQLDQVFPTDFDLDGDTDLLQIQFRIGLTEVFRLRNAGTGTSFPRQVVVRISDQVLSAAPLDVNGDGLVDLALLQPGGASVRLGTGGGDFAAPVAFDMNVSMLFRLRTADFDLDGDLDVVALSDVGELWWAENLPASGLGTFQAAGVTGLSFGQGLQLLDVNVDGLVDIVFAGAAADGNRDVVRLGQAGGSFAPLERIGSGQFTTSATRFGDLDGDGDLDGISWASGSISLHGNAATDFVGGVVPLCDEGSLNSAGLRGEMVAYGTAGVGSTDLVLQALRLPQDQFGLFVGSRTSIPPVAVAGSLGSVCLGGAIGRYDEPSQIRNSESSGSFSIPLDPTRLETSAGRVPAMVGETWTFQAWHRDLTPMGVPTSNFTNALAITFLP